MIYRIEKAENMSEEEVKMWLRFYSMEGKRIAEETAILKYSIAQLKKRKLAIEKQLTKKTTEYSKDWSIAKKAAYILSTIKQPMTAGDITRRIITYDKLPAIYSRELTVKVASTLITYVNKGLTFDRKKHKQNGYWYYVLKTWCEDGKIKPEYKKAYRNK